MKLSTFTYVIAINVIIAGSAAFAMDDPRNMDDPRHSTYRSTKPKFDIIEPRVELFSVFGDEVTPRKKRDFFIETDESTPPREIIAKVDVTGNSFLFVDYIGELCEGEFRVGLFTENKRSLIQYNFHAVPGEIKDSIELPAGTNEKSVWLLFSSPTKATFKIDNFRVRMRLKSPE